MDNLNKMLEYLENIIDVDKCSEILKEEENVLNYKPMEKINVRVLYNPCMKAYGMQEMHESIEKMMYNELVSCVPHIQSGTGIPMIRANYGVGTLPSLFGLTCKILNNNMPWVEHVTKDQVKEIISKGIPNLDTGFGRRLTLTHEFYQEKLEKYPKCRDFIKIYHPDFQGPLDVAHLIYGSDIYMDMYDEPELVHELLELVTDTYIEIMKRTKKEINDEYGENCFHWSHLYGGMYDEPELVHELLELVTDTYIEIMKRTKKEINDEYGENCFHWSHLYGGHVVVRNDSAVNISADMYKEFVQPYDEKILEAFGGGSIHYCGKADQWVFDMLRTKNLRAMNFGYLEKFNFGNEYLKKIGETFASHKMPIIDYVLSKKEFQEMEFDRFHDGISYCVQVDNLEDGKEILKQSWKKQ